MGFESRNRLSMLVRLIQCQSTALYVEFLNWPRKGYAVFETILSAGPMPSCRDHISFAGRKKQVCLQPVLAGVEIEVAATQRE